MLQRCPSHIQLILATKGMKWHFSAPTTVPAKSSKRSGKKCRSLGPLVHWWKQCNHGHQRLQCLRSVRSKDQISPTLAAHLLQLGAFIMPRPGGRREFPNFKVTLTCWCQATSHETMNNRQPKKSKTGVTSGSLSFFHQHLLRAILKEVYEGLHGLLYGHLRTVPIYKGHRLTWSSIPSLSTSSSENSGSLSTSEGGGDGLRSR